MAVMSPEFHLTTSTTTPSTPRLSGDPFEYNFFYTSAPTSPRLSGDNNDFAFDSGRLSIANPLPEISTADQLFDNGRIRPLQFTPKQEERGRKRGAFDVSSEKNRARASRSLSPLRCQETSVNLPKSESGSRKWRLKDLLLFRSVSEGRDPLRNYALFSSLFSSSSLPRSSKKGGKEERGRRQGVSAHAIHYRENRATAEEQRRKTPLAYQRQGFFDFIQYNPAIRSIAKGFNGNSSRP